MDLGIQGKNAIVCASSRGLGRACAIALAREGVNVTINGRNEEAIQEVVGSCSKFGCECAECNRRHNQGKHQGQFAGCLPCTRHTDYQ